MNLLTAYLLGFFTVPVLGALALPVLIWIGNRMPLEPRTSFEQLEYERQTRNIYEQIKTPQS
jgi:hypothetical protein